MYKHILVPTDGSKLAAKGVKAGVKLAKALGAKITGLYVIPPYTPPVYSEGAMFQRALGPQQYKKATEKSAKTALASVEIEAELLGVEWKTEFVTAERPWEGILKVARAMKCDAIAMATHGRSGLGGLLLGSETTKVLAHSKLPVLVSR